MVAAAWAGVGVSLGASLKPLSARWHLRGRKGLYLPKLQGPHQWLGWSQQTPKLEMNSATLSPTLTS